MVLPIAAVAGELDGVISGRIQRVPLKVSANAEVWMSVKPKALALRAPGPVGLRRPRWTRQTERERPGRQSDRPGCAEQTPARQLRFRCDLHTDPPYV